jgi:hypothetical protein
VINFVYTAGIGAPLRNLLPTLSVPARKWTYEAIARRKNLPKGTWIFTDHERRSAFETAVAAAIAQQLREAGCLVLNHPAEVESRFVLLDRLWQHGINAFRAYRADEGPRPARFPVFIRREYDHRVDARSLIHDQSELDAELARLRAEGTPLLGRLVIEYASTEAAPSIWFRGSAYRVGDAIIAHHMALDDTWLVKNGFDAARLDAFAGRDQFLEQERAFVVDNQHAELFRRIFDIAGIQYGRADFGFENGTIQVYEINTNPTHGAPGAVFGNIHPGREATQRLSELRLRDALNALDTEAGGSVELTGPLMRSQRRLFPLLPIMLRRP